MIKKKIWLKYTSITSQKFWTKSKFFITKNRLETDFEIFCRKFTLIRKLFLFFVKNVILVKPNKRNISKTILVIKPNISN